MEFTRENARNIKNLFFEILPSTETVLEFATARLSMCPANNERYRKWVKICKKGILCVIIDRTVSRLLLRLYDFLSFEKLFEVELYKNIAKGYTVDGNFHYIEFPKFFLGITFVDLQALKIQQGIKESTELDNRADSMKKHILNTSKLLEIDFDNYIIDTLLLRKRLLDIEKEKEEAKERERLAKIKEEEEREEKIQEEQARKKKEEEEEAMAKENNEEDGNIEQLKEMKEEANANPNDDDNIEHQEEEVLQEDQPDIPIENNDEIEAIKPEEEPKVILNHKRPEIDKTRMCDNFDNEIRTLIQFPDKKKTPGFNYGINEKDIPKYFTNFNILINRLKAYQENNLESKDKKEEEEEEEETEEIQLLNFRAQATQKNNTEDIEDTTKNAQQRELEFKMRELKKIPTVSLEELERERKLKLKREQELEKEQKQRQELAELQEEEDESESKPVFFIPDINQQLAQRSKARNESDDNDDYDDY